MAEESYDYLFKLVLIGDSGIGKSNIILRFSDDRFKTDLFPSFGTHNGTDVSVDTYNNKCCHNCVHFKTKTIELEGKKIKLEIWNAIFDWDLLSVRDTSGQERFRAITRSYCRGAMGIMLVYDITQDESFENISKWLREIKEYASADVEKIIVGNKCHKEDKRVVSRERGNSYARERGIPFLEVCAKHNINIKEAFYTLVQNILKRQLDKDTVPIKAENAEASIFGRLSRLFSRTEEKKEEKEGNDVIYNDAYFRALEDGEEKNTRIPVMIVGQDRAGKTSLKKHLLGWPFEIQEPSTCGIEVDVVELTDKNADKPWKRKKEKQFFTSADKAEEQVLKYTAQLVKQRRQGSNSKDHNSNNGEDSVAHSRKREQPNFGTKQAKPLPQNVVDKIQVLTKNKSKEESPPIEVFVHDLAGQSIYYDTHFCFLKMHCPYVLVHDLKTPLEEPAQPRFKFQSIDVERQLNNPLIATNLDHFLSWLTVLARLRDSESDMFTSEFTDFQLPPVVIALTNSDQFKGDIAKVKKRIKDILTEKGFENVFTELYVIDNTLKNRAGDEIRRLRRKLYNLCLTILEKQRPMPVRWLQFEGALSNKMMVENVMHIPVEEARAVAKSCSVKEIDAAISFLHHQGIIVHHSESPVVVLNPQWLMNLFAKVITVPKEENPRDASFHKLLKKGILMQEYLRKRVDGELLEGLMKQFSLICCWKFDGKPAFIVPSVAPLMEKGKDVQEELSESPIVSIFVEFSCLYAPIGFLTRFLVYMMNMCKKDLLNTMPQLYCNYSLLSFSRSEGQFDVYVVKIPAKIKIGVVPRATFSQQSHCMFVSYLMQVLESCIETIKDEEPLMYRNVSVSFALKCSVCYGEKEVCLHHGKTRCDRDECGHFWPLDELEGFTEDPICVYGSDVRTRRFPLENVKVWLNTGATKSAERARVVCDFEGRKDEVLSVRKDDIVTILEKDVQLGLSQAAMDGKVGLLPDDCFKLLPPEEVKDEKEENEIVPEGSVAVGHSGPHAIESINDLDLLVKQGVCKKLDILDDVGGDFRTLAAHFGMPSDKLDLISQNGNATHRVLRWAERNPENTFAKLREILLDMERWDCVKIIDEGPKSGGTTTCNR